MQTVRSVWSERNQPSACQSCRDDVIVVLAVMSPHTPLLLNNEELRRGEGRVGREAALFHCNKLEQFIANYEFVKYSSELLPYLTEPLIQQLEYY